VLLQNLRVAPTYVVVSVDIFGAMHCSGQVHHEHSMWNTELRSTIQTHQCHYDAVALCKLLALPAAAVAVYVMRAWSSDRRTCL
jgi:hypothetical protein